MIVNIRLACGNQIKVLVGPRYGWLKHGQPAFFPASVIMYINKSNLRRVRELPLVRPIKQEEKVPAFPFHAIQQLGEQAMVAQEHRRVIPRVNTQRKRE
jgi:hypothetical protein